MQKGKISCLVSSNFHSCQNCCNRTNAHKATTKPKKPKKGQFRSKRQKPLARMPHKSPQQPDPTPNTREKRQNQTKRPTEKKRVVERERGKSSLRADPPRPPPARIFISSKTSSAFHSHAPASKKRKCLTPSVPDGSTACAFF